MVRYHIHPRRRRHFIARDSDDVLAAIRCESSQAIEENQITQAFLRHLYWRLLAIALALRVGLACNERAICRREVDIAELFREWTVTIGNNHACHGLKQNSIFGRDMVGELYQDAA